VPDDLILISGREEVVLAAPRIEQVIYNRWKINSDTRRYSARLTRHKPEIKDTKDHARLIRWASLTHLHKRAYEYK
jgi:hypothetical protein